MNNRIIRLVLAGLLLSSSVTIRAGAFEDFFTAIIRDDPRSAEQLILRGFDVNSRDEQGQTAFVVALRAESFKVAELLLRQASFQVDAINAANETALMLAAIKGQTEWVKRLLDKGAAINRDGWNALHYAASGPEPSLVALLLDRGAALNARSPNGSTALMMAARYGSEAAVKVLRDRGADVRLRNDRDLNAADFARLAGRVVLAAELERDIR